MRVLEEACVTAVQGRDDEKIANSLLSHPEQRFRLSYLLGSWPKPESANNPDFSFDYGDGDVNYQDDLISQEESVAESEQSKNQSVLRGYIHRIKEVTGLVKSKIAEGLETPEDMGNFQSDNDREAWLELFEEELYQHDEFADIASDIRDDVIARSKLIESGEFERNSDGWPTLWKYSEDNRDVFLREVRWFSSNHHQQFGRLLTPAGEWAEGARAIPSCRREIANRQSPSLARWGRSGAHR